MFADPQGLNFLNGALDEVDTGLIIHHNCLKNYL
jgi:hypothetical protein